MTTSSITTFPRKQPTTTTALPAHPRDWILGIDRSDTRLDVRQCRRDGSEASDYQVANTPEALQQWLASWPLLESGTTRVIAFEQPCRQLLGFFHRHVLTGRVRLYALNPSTPTAMRRAFTPSNDKTDLRDATAIADVLRHHEDKLIRWLHRPGDEATRLLRRLTEDRRQAVDERTALTNALIAVLKEAYPQALKLLSADLWRSMNTDFLKRWPTLKELQAAKPDTIRKFYYAHGSNRADLITARIALIQAAEPITHDDCLLSSARRKVLRLAEQIAVLTRHIADYEEEIAKLYANHPDRAVYDSLPGAGPTFAPRLAGVMGQDRSTYAGAPALQARSGIAPIRRQSGKKSVTVRRIVCPQFERQTFVEWAGETIPRSLWAKAYYQSQIEAGKMHHSAVRALAYKWQRILYRCWKDKTEYDEAKYLAALRRQGSPLIARIEVLQAQPKTPKSKPAKAARITRVTSAQPNPKTM
ncbi:MAG TPA: IS110 family transposase [Verrucomicrobiales bacterium]|nr:IS110 family transposase [Verrucomicrobiales bacterium]